MALLSGERLGPYEILNAIGAGGMGEVYKARDTRLDRVVAVKTSKEQFTERFEREARAVASLNHPNICTLHDVGPNYLVMEYIEGPTLADRIASGPIPLAEALPIARQIAEALEAAHEKGIVHRDLKPANIKLTSDGKVKVLDFGLAKAFDSDSSRSSQADSPTLTLSSTRAGMILGTAGYMSPEQARGVPADKRADIWSFGVVLLEMLTGRVAFAGETVSDTLAAVLRADVNWNSLPAGTPAALRRLLRRCLERDRKKRLHDIADAALELDEPPEIAPAPVAQRSSRWLIAALGVAVIGIIALAVVHFRESAPASPPTARFQLPLPPKSTFGNHLSISPDGRLIAFVAATGDARNQIWVRPIDGLEAKPLAGTEDAGYLFWSPDSRFIGFWAMQKLKRIEAGGGPAQTICETGLALGSAWGADGFIVLGSNAGRGLARVPATGGTPTPLTKVDLPHGEASHSWPLLLPDGKHLIYLAGSATDMEHNAVRLATLDSNRITAEKTLFHSRTGVSLVLSPIPNRAHLLFLRESTLMAHPFNLDTLELAGEAFAVANPVGSFLTRPYFAASRSGTLVYRTGGIIGADTHLEWRDRTGRILGTFGESRFILDLNLAHDDTRVAVSRGQSGVRTDIWQLDSRRGTSTRLTFRGTEQSDAVWSPDDSRIVFASGAPSQIMQKISSGAGPEDTLLKLATAARPCDWSRNGKFLLYVTEDPRTRTDLWVLPLEPGSKPLPYLQTEFAEMQGQFSPDGRWVAYVSDESGKFDVYVQPFPASGGKWQISTAGGIQPRWRSDGKELYYIAPDRSVMAAEIKTGGGFEAGVPKALFASRVLPIQTSPTGSYRYSPTSDGQRFLMVALEEGPSDAPLTLVLNWRPGGSR